MSTKKKTQADNERRLWRVAADYQFGQHSQEPRNPARFKRIMSLMAEEFEAKSDDEVLQHVAYRKKAAKKGATVSYFEVTGRKMNGIFCRNELNSVSQEMTASLTNHDKGGRIVGYNDPDMDRREVALDYQMYAVKLGNKSEAARQVCLDHWGLDENGDLPQGDQLHALINKLDRWVEDCGL